MSQLLINDYLRQLDLIKKISGSSRETIVREAFKDLLKHWGKQHDLITPSVSGSDKYYFDSFQPLYLKG